jgi:hypothetical protein
MRKRIVRGRLSYGMADRTLRHMTGEPIITLTRPLGVLKPASYSDEFFPINRNISL